MPAQVYKLNIRKIGFDITQKNKTTSAEKQVYSAAVLRILRKASETTE